MVDPNEYQQLDNDWIDEFLEDDSDDVFEDLEFDDQSGEILTLITLHKNETI